jgi:E3 ubiquitin-protein ligase BRE1
LAVATARPVALAEENGKTPEVNEDYEEFKVKHAEAIAVVERQKEQIESLLAEVKGLRDENATFKVKKEAITDEDYARTEAFKQFKALNEDLVRRINHLEAINKQLREETEKLQGERTSFKIELEKEAQIATSDLEEQVQRLEADLTRIRSARDDLYAEREARRAHEEQERTAAAHLRELIEVKDDRISAMESELERLRPGEDVRMTTPREDLDAIPIEELREKFLKLERDFEAINKEMPLLEKSYKKSASMANKKVLDFAALEDKVSNLSSEKTKTDQKYFASKRECDTTKNELRHLRTQNQKSSEIVAQLKAVEVHNKGLIQNLEKQVADLRQSNLTVAGEKKKYEASSLEANQKADATKTQISDLSNEVKIKDVVLMKIKEEKLAQEREIDKLKARVTHITADRDSWKSKKLSNSSEDEDMLRVSLHLTTWSARTRD